MSNLNNKEREEKEKMKGLIEAQKDLISQLNKNCSDMNKKLDRNKVKMVTDFIEK